MKGYWFGLFIGGLAWAISTGTMTLLRDISMSGMWGGSLTLMFIGLLGVVLAED